MDIPTQEEFQLFIKHASEKPCEAIPLPTRELLGPIEASQAYFQTCLEAAEAHRQRTKQLHVWRWLDSQGDFRRAMRAAASHGGYDPMTAIDAAAELRKHQVQIAQLVSEHSYVKTKLKRNARWPDECRTPDERFWRYLVMHGRSHRPLRLYADIGSALQGYYHGAAPHGNAHSEQIADATKAIQSAVSSLVDDVAPVCRVMPFPSTAGSRIAGILRRLDLLSRELLRDQERAYPTTRNDDTARERRLVWDLRTAFRKCFGVDKPTAIFYLTQLHGIRRPPDKRSIERSLLDWRTRGTTGTAAEKLAE